MAELKMLHFIMGVSRMAKIKNEYRRGTAHVGRIKDELEEARVKWFRHVLRKNNNYVGRRIMEMNLHIKRKGEGQKDGIGMQG